MPKRSRKDDSDYLRKKLRKIERKLNRRKKRSRNRISSDSDNSDEFDDPASISPYRGGEDVSSIRRTPTNDEPQPGPSTVPVDTIGVTDSVELTAAGAADASPELHRLEPLTEPDPILDELDEELLTLLGEKPSTEKILGADIQLELAQRLEHIATTGLTKETRKELIDKHLIPKNCTKIDSPRLNPEIKAALSDSLIKKDKALQMKQAQLAAAISCVGNALTKMFAAEHRDPSVIKSLFEASRLMCDAQHKESITRRSFIYSTIKKDIKDQLYDTSIDSFLFGEKLADTLKAAKAISKSGSEIKINTMTKRTPASQKIKQAVTQPLNQKPPLPAARPRAARRTELAPPPTSTFAARYRAQPPPRQPPRSQQRPAPRR